MPIRVEAQRQYKQYLIEQAIAKKVPQWKVAELLGLSLRQIQRYVKAFRIQGPEGLLRKTSDKKPHNAFPPETREKIVTIIKNELMEFGPTLISKHLSEHSGIVASKETVRRIMISEGLWESGAPRVTRRARRKR
ncbi:MAG: helix-turn-helix domain-containing protein [Deltaproteobacteria bacterium]|nr:helix-turn-helix domain-containing protein [Deltaproteobacteria bacterium]